MKRLQPTLLCLAIIVSPILLGAQNASPALSYLQQINTEHNAVTNKNLEYIQYMVHIEDFNEIEKKRLEVIQQMDETIARTAAMPAFEGNVAMRDEMLATVKSYRESFKVEFNELNLLKKESKASYEAMEAYINAQDAAEKKLGQTSKKFYAAQKAFAKANNITLVDGDDNTEVDQINRVNAYHRAIFLRYFKVSKNSAAFWDAVQKEDAKAMERARIMLSNDADAALLDLRKMPDFNGDKDYLNATIRIVEFYDNLAEEGYKQMTLVQRKTEMTQQDVDTYNGVVTYYNENVNDFLKAYNDALNQLLRNNVPKPKTSTTTKRI